MKCPLLVAGYWGNTPGFNTTKTDCLQEECALWDRHFEQCSLLSVSEHLWDMRGEVADIKARIPNKERLV